MLADLANELKLLIRSRHPIVSIETADEQRAIELIHRVAQELDRPLFEWSSTMGLVRRRPTPATGPVAQTESIKHALAFIHDASECSVYLFRDMADLMKDGVVARKVRDIHTVFAREGSTLVLVDTHGSLPESVRRLAAPFDIKWPDFEELEKAVREAFQEARVLYKVTTDLSKRQVEQLIQSLRGLTAGEAFRVVSAALYDDYQLTTDDLPRIIEAKRAILASSGVLEAIPVDVNIDDVGGLSRLKAWLSKRRGGFSAKAKEFGLTPPRGILLLGVQGGGKSLCAKAVAADWGMPLLRLDPGVLYQRFVGESEGRLRQALSQAETMSPVVLWIDEIEKAFASASSASADGGLSQRMFGTLLAWMQEHKHAVFIVATANDVSALPPELLRKGRFDEVFFVDLPTPAARESILSIHLKRRSRDPKKYALSRLSQVAEGFSGAELEQVVVSALYAAFASGGDLTDDVLEAEIKGTRPLSVLMAERMEELREWASERCVPAD